MKARTRKPLVQPRKRPRSRPVAKILGDQSTPEERRIKILQDENKALKGRLKTVVGEEALFHALAHELSAWGGSMRLRPHGAKPRVKARAGRIAEDLVLHLSDEHADQIVLPHRVNGLEEYNFRVALARAERLVDSVTKFATRTLSNYDFPTLWILANGDHINGEIHDASAVSEYKNVFRNTLAVGQMHALMFRDLAAAFPRVKVVYTAGNHGRRTRRKEYVAGAWNNWDYLVGETARLMCADLPTVEFLIPDAWSVNLDIRGWIFNVSHGDDVKAWNSIPFYGMERQTRRLQSLAVVEGQSIHYFARGHFHTPATLSNPAGEILMNGAWKATDEYAFHALGGYNKPAQLLHGVHPEHGVTWRVPVHLKFPGDTDGPKRYRVNLAEEE